MADRIFAAVLLAVTLAYGIIAFTVIRAQFQYDPLGPESWPRILSVVAGLCLLWILWKPDLAGLDVAARTLGRLAATVLLLLGYAWAYEPLGFILATLLFGTVLAAMLQAGPLRAVAFGAAGGVLGWLVGVTLLGLNLPEGEIWESLALLGGSP